MVNSIWTRTADCCIWRASPVSMVSCTKELFEVAALICIDALAEDAAQEDDGMVLIVLKWLDWFSREILQACPIKYGAFL